MGLLLGKIIPMNMLAQMPLHFVRRLRDIRLKQVEEANRQQELQMQKVQNNDPRRYRPNTGMDSAMFNGTSFDDLIDELT